jgi:nicotinamidase-related amidase
MKNVQILAIDFQNDFCNPKGSLFVKGADDDCKRAAAFIKQHAHLITDIHATLDSHHQIDIAHPLFWIDMSTMQPPTPYTLITHQDLLDGKFRTRIPAFMNPTPNFIGALEYTKSLENNGRYSLCIWPVHCDIGSWGYGFQQDFYDAIVEWENKEFGLVNKVCKGSNWTTEHYSIFQADVPDPNDIEGTGLNMGLINCISGSDETILMGEALDYCVANSVRDLVNNLSDSDIAKLVFFMDCSSPVNAPGQEHLAPTFISDMKTKGVRFMNSTDYIFS